MGVLEGGCFSSGWFTRCFFKGGFQHSGFYMNVEKKCFKYGFGRKESGCFQGGCSKVGV